MIRKSIFKINFMKKTFRIAVHLFIASAILFATSFAQTAPGWSRGQQLLQISYDDCLTRASQALTTLGYRIDYSQGSFRVGIKDPHTAIINCLPAPTGTYVIIVVSSNGDGGGLQRQCLQALMENPVASTPCIGGNTQGAACGLGKYWDETEEGWQATWTRRGTSNIFDVVQTKGSMRGTSVQTITITGNKVHVSRTNASDGNNCEMDGTIGSDGVTVEGTYRCYNGGPYNWRATIRCQ